MQTMDDWGRRLSSRAQWLRLGLLSAGVISPLIGRWNELRAAERARQLREDAEESLKGVGGIAPWTRRQIQQQIEEIAERVGTRQVPSRKVSTALWLAGVGVGLTAAGVAAYVVVRRRMATSEETLVAERPSLNGKGTLNGAGGSSSSATDYAPHPSARPAATTTPLAEAPTDPRLGAVTAEAPAQLPAEDVTAPQESVAAEELVAPEMPVASAMPAAQEETAAEPAEPEVVTDPDQAPFVGNVRTMIYHESDTENLPAEENRVYFATEDEAREAGFRRDRDEVPSE